MTVRSGSSVEVDHVSFGYRREPVIRDVSLGARSGGFLGIIGPNGSGKSTLLRLISGVLRPAAGRVLLDGVAVVAMSRLEVGRRVAMVPQETPMQFPYTVLEMVLFGRTPHLSGFAFERADDLRIAREALERTRTLELEKRPVLELSGGERQRVALARALAQEPRVLLLDEPSAFLDIRHEVEMYDLLRELQGEGVTVISVLHDLNLAALYCEQVVLLSEGAVFQQGEPTAVMTYENLTSVYQTEIYVSMNDITHALNVLPLDGRSRRALEAQRSGGGRNER
jgi:iron complex transport system ATP-binding protein